MSDIASNSQPLPPGRPDRAHLFDIASEQGGYFTTAQARCAGFSRALLSHHTRAGRFIRVRTGLYRLHEYPSSPREDVLTAWLALGKDTAVVSHDSALDLLDLSDVVPDSVHLTVPRAKRHFRSLPGTTIHTTTRPLRPSDRTTHDAVSLTSATRTILDAAEAGTDPEQVERAVIQAVQRGLATRQQLRQEAGLRNRRVLGLIERALRVVEQ